VVSDACTAPNYAPLTATTVGYVGKATPHPRSPYLPGPETSITDDCLQDCAFFRERFSNVPFVVQSKFIRYSSPSVIRSSCKRIEWGKRHRGQNHDALEFWTNTLADYDPSQRSVLLLRMICLTCRFRQRYWPWIGGLYVCLAATRTNAGNRAYSNLSVPQGRYASCGCRKKSFI
jgi:hypothetical protein